MEKKYCSVYELASYSGIFYIIFLGIFALFDFYLFHWDNLAEYFNNFDYKEILLGIGIILINFVSDLSSLFTIKINTPYHAFIIGEFITITSNIIDIKYIAVSTINLIIMIICYIIIFFFSLVFNEIIEINCFGLSYNTRRYIIKREKKEDLTMLGGPSLDLNEGGGGSVIHLEMNDIGLLAGNEIYK